MNRKFAAVPLCFGSIVLMLALAACGTASRVSVAISPVTATVKSGTTQQFSAVVTGAKNTAVQWEVNGIVGGNEQYGTISTNGLYTAPVTNISREVAVSAVASAQRSKPGVALVTVTGTPMESAPNGLTPPPTH